ncbi:hypothetical protein CW304_29990 [Bacillus sp. UFRGS-B20]|nr:hypothetical protein CW304_29990 [Bacillus sp. UFRGS-B20]
MYRIVVSFTQSYFFLYFSARSSTSHFFERPMTVNLQSHLPIMSVIEQGSYFFLAYFIIPHCFPH